MKGNPGDEFAASFEGHIHINLIESYENNLQIVIASSEIKYLSPVVSDFQAICSFPTQSDWERFIQMLERKKKGRKTLKAKIYCEDHLCVEYSGVFAAIRDLSSSI